MRLVCLLLFFSFVGYGQNPCLPATGYSYLDMNNVTALIENSGSLFKNNNYKVKGETLSSYSGIWIGCLDSTNQLHLAAIQYGSGDDFWPGPIRVDSLLTDDSTCNEFDRVWKINKWQVEEFLIKYQDPSYTIPEVILNWPANGNTQQNYSQNLAPFSDLNNDGFYNPHDGDYPKFNISNNLNCSEHQIFGDQCIYFVMNDVGNSHSESGGLPIGVEIHAQAFAFRGTMSLDNTTFYNYKIINRSNNNYNQLYFGNFLNPSIGCANDDYVGCDVTRGLGYAYNANSVDAGCVGSIGPPGANLPALGVDFVKGPKKNDDGFDNPLTSDVNLAYSAGGIPYSGLGFGYGDGIIDNERLGMNTFGYTSISFGSSSYYLPQNPLEYYGWMKGYWRDGTHFVYGASGNLIDPNASSIETNFCFPGLSDTLSWGTISTGSGIIAPYTPWDQRWPLGTGSTPMTPGAYLKTIQSVGPVNFEANDTIDITFAIIYAKEPSLDPFQSVQKLMIVDDTIQGFTDSCFQTSQCLQLVKGFQYQNSNLIFHFAYEMEADSYNWSFGDGSTSNLRFPKHTYQNHGIYNVCVSANKTNCSSISYCTNISTIGTDTVVIECDSALWNGTTYYNTGIYYDTIQSSNGLDSIVSMLLTINNTSNNNIDTVTACDSYTWVNSNTYNTSNYTDTYVLSNMGGCDSLITLNLTINQSSSGTDSQTACNFYTWIDGNTYTTSTNTPTYTLTNAAGCDSIVTLNLTVNDVDNGISNNSPTLIANASTGNYQWLDCDNNFTPLPNETNQYFTATINGNYAVEVIQNNCIDTSSCELVNNVGIKYLNSNLTLQPNPTTDIINILGYNGSIKVEVYSFTGQLLQTTNSTTISLKEHPKGIYLFKVAYGDRVEKLKVVKE